MQDDEASAPKAPPAPLRREGWRAFLVRHHNGFLDDARGRGAMLNQLLLCAIVLVVSALVVLGGGSVHPEMFLVGVLVVFGGGAATLVVPWHRLPPMWIVAIPALDIFAITVIRQSEPDAGFGLLWAFPAMWLASLGLVGLVFALVSISAIYWALIAVTPDQAWTFTSFLLPLVIVAIASTAYVSTRRFNAQRVLLDKQAGLLSRALRRAQRHEQLMVDVMDAVDFGVIRISDDGEVTIVNEALSRIQQLIPEFGRLDRPLRHAYASDGVTPLPEDDRPLQRAVRGEIFENVIVWFGASDAGRRWAFSMTARRIRDASGADAGAVLVARDVTAELMALRARDRLVASVSHELRTPLTSILGYLDLATEEQDLPATARGYLEVAQRNGERLLEIVADILAASSASRSSVDMTISPEVVDVAPLVRQSAEACAAWAGERAIRIDTGGLEPAAAFADPLRLRQVIDNLVSNAVKYNRDGGEVALSSTTDGRSTWIVVRDTGAGIAADDQQRLFERFFRARADVGGTGLGLSISRDIVRAHGGEISVRSTPGVGSTFVVRLPASADADDADEEIPPHEAVIADVEARAADAPARRARRAEGTR